MDTVVEDLLGCLDDPALPLLQWNEEYAVVQARLPSGLAVCLEAAVEDYTAELNAATADDDGAAVAAEQLLAFPAAELAEAMDAALKVRGSEPCNVKFNVIHSKIFKQHWLFAAS